MKAQLVSQIHRGLIALCAVFCFSLSVQSVTAQPQMDPNQIVDMIAANIGVEEDQKEKFSVVMKEFFEKVMPLGQQMMSGTGDQAELQAKMTTLGEELEKKLSTILTPEQIQSFAQMQQSMGGPPQ